MSFTIALEFGSPGFETGTPILRVNGTDTIVHLDGRWGRQRRDMEIQAHVAYLRMREGSKYRDMLFVGWVGLGRNANHRGFMLDHDAPDWVDRHLQWETAAGRGPYAELLNKVGR